MRKLTSRHSSRSSLNLKIAVWLRTNRVKEKLRQEDIAKVLNISHQAVNKYETGVCKLSADTLLKLVLIFKWSIEDIIPEYQKELKPHMTNTTIYNENNY